MALITKKRRVANPRPLRKLRKRKANASATRRHKKTATGRNSRGQFTKRKARTKRKTSATVRVTVSNPRRKRTKRTRRNPAALVTLGAMNPKKGTTMAKRRRKMNSRRRRSAAPKIIVLGGGPRRKRRMNPRRRRSSVSVRRRRNSYRRRNPQIFGMGLNTKTGTTLIAGGLVGVAATKAITAAVVSRVPMLQSDFGRIAVSLGTAYGVSMLGEKFMGQAFGSALFFGGLMQSGSMALNTFMPSIGSAFGLGEFMAAGLVTPYNPILQGQQQAMLAAAAAAESDNQVRIGVNGLSRTYGQAY